MMKHAGRLHIHFHVQYVAARAIMSSAHSFFGLLPVNGKQEQALEALQLSLKLQSSRSREELRRLLRFMAAAANVQEVRLHKEVSPRVHVVCSL